MVTAANFFTCCCQCVYHVSALSCGEGCCSGTSNRVKLLFMGTSNCQMYWIKLHGGGGVQEDSHSASVQGSSAGGSSRSEDPRRVLEIGVMLMLTTFDTCVR